MKKICLLLLTILISISTFPLMAFGCSDGTSSGTQSGQSSKLSIDKSTVEAKVEQLWDNYYSVTISGIAKNKTNKTYSYAAISYTILDEDGNQIGTAIDNISNLAAKGTWKFSAIGTVNSYPAKYRLADITAI